jgi:coproporphyrinogen III oxidase-like Fe-S oxidoreductase
MTSILNNLPDDVQSEVYEFMYDRPLKNRVMRELLHRMKCIECDSHLSPRFCMNGANYCSLSCYIDREDDYIDEYLEELEQVTNGNTNFYGP